MSPRARRANNSRHTSKDAYAVDDRSFTCSTTTVDAVPAPGIHYPRAISYGPSTLFPGKPATTGDCDLFILDVTPPRVKPSAAAAAAVQWEEASTMPEASEQVEKENASAVEKAGLKSNAKAKGSAKASPA